MSWWELMKLRLQLRTESENAREQAARQLGNLGDPKAVEMLISALKDRGPSVRRIAAISLGQLKDERAVEPLIAAMKDRNPAMRKAIFTSLGQIGDSRAMPLLMVALKDVDVEIRRVAGFALANMGAFAVEPLIEKIGDEDEYVRKEAMGILGKIRDPRAFPPLVEALMSGRADRAMAATALSTMGWEPVTAEERYMFAFVKGNHEEPVHDGSKAIPALLSLVSDPFPDIRRAVIQALGQINDRRAVEPLKKILQADDNPEVRDTAARALGIIGDPAALDTLVEALEDDEPHVRPTAARALGMLKDARAIPFLVNALSDKKFIMRKTAAEALAYLGKMAVEALLDALMSVDPSSRPFVIESLGHIGDKRAVGPLMVAIREKEPAIRREAARALGLLGDERAVEALVAVLDDENGEVWMNAARALSRFGDPRAIGPLLKFLENDSYAAHTVQAIEFVLSHNISHVSEVDLRALCALSGIVQEPPRSAGAIGQSAERIPVDCAKLNELARQELQRRGITL